MAEPEEKPTTIQADIVSISIELDRTTGNMNFNASHSGTVTLLGMLESAKLLVLQMKQRSVNQKPETPV